MLLTQGCIMKLYDNADGQLDSNSSFTYSENSSSSHSVADLSGNSSSTTLTEAATPHLSIGDPTSAEPRSRFRLAGVEESQTTDRFGGVADRLSRSWSALAPTGLSLSPSLRSLPSADKGKLEYFAPQRQPYMAMVRQAIERGQDSFFSRQESDGHWRYELEGDALLQGEMVILLAFLHREDSPLAHKLANKLILTQSSTGGWPMFTGGEDSLTNTVKAYFALKLTGHDPSKEYMQKARQAVMRMGGADGVNSFTRFYLALLGQISYDQCPAVPPEMYYLPNWFPINLYAVSSWTRTIIVPLSIVSALRPSRTLPPEKGIQELFVQSPENWPPLSAPKVKRPKRGKFATERKGFFSWEKFFRFTDWSLKKYQKILGWSPLRTYALDQMEGWLWGHCYKSDGPGAIQPPIVWGLVAMIARGHDLDSEQCRYFLKQLDDLLVEDEDGPNGEKVAHMQPCKSPVWDTLLTLRSLAAGGIRADNTTEYARRARKAVNWLLNQQHSNEGDWSVKTKVEPGGWAFEYNNFFYPDCDDSAMALMALHELHSEKTPRWLLPSLGSKKGVETDTRENVEAAQDKSTIVLSSKGNAAEEKPEAAVNATGLVRPEESELAAPTLEEGEVRATHALRSKPDFSGLKEAPETRLIINEQVEDLDAARKVVARFDRIKGAIDRCVRWLEGMQNKDGGWASFDKGNNREFLCHVPFADHNAMIDPSTTDITGRVLEAFGALGRRVGEPIIDRAVRFIRSEQLPDGSWFGRWGVNYIYGTGEALNGLAAVKCSPDDPMIRAAANWLLCHQQPCGGWGETAESYKDPTLRGTGTVTASQTAWALLGLISNGYQSHPAVVRGIKYLIDSQRPDGRWDEPEFTGTGFPMVFYLRYHGYRDFFPLKAISDWAACFDQTEINEMIASVAAEESDEAEVILPFPKKKACNGCF